MEPTQANSVHFTDVDAENRGSCSAHAASLCVAEREARPPICQSRATGPAVSVWDPPQGSPYYCYTKARTSVSKAALLAEVLSLQTVLFIFQTVSIWGCINFAGTLLCICASGQAMKGLSQYTTKAAHGEPCPSSLAPLRSQQGRAC